MYYSSSSDISLPSGLPAGQPSSRLDSGFPPKKKSRFKTRHQETFVGSFLGIVYYPGKNILINPLTPTSDQDRISPYNINIILTK